jgi:hypothetical protein
LLCAAAGSAGLTLGRAQSPALVGQPLDLRIQVQFDSSEDAQSACLNAEVFYGDSQVDPSRVSVAVDAAADAANRPATVRVSTTVPVNEPVVTVNLRSGCQIRSSKRYTLLADLPTQVVEQQPARATSRATAPQVDVPRVAAPVSAALAPVAAPKEPVAATAPRPTAPRKPKAALAVTPTVAPPVPVVAAPPARAAKPVRAAGRARLKLDPLDLLIEKDPVLRASDELLSQPQEDGPQRAEAAALWRALNATPEQILRDEVQAQRAAEDLKALYNVTTQNQKGLIELVAKVERAESERYANGLVYTLMALCLLSLAALVWIWQRMRNAGGDDWKHGLDAGDSLMAELMETKSHSRRAAAPVPQPVEPPEASRAAPPPPTPPAVVRAGAPAAAPAAVPVAPPPAALTEVDLDLDEIHTQDDAQRHPPPHAGDPWATPAAAAPSAWRRLEVPPLPAVPRGDVDFSISGAPALRAVDAEELEDTRHQAEFFVSLGQHDKAVDILTTRIAQRGQTSPQLCLDLLKIYHTMGRESEYAFMRTECQHWFTAKIPAFADFGHEGRALDQYPQVVSRIVNLWPGPPVLEYIEECLYHHAGAVDTPEFDLLAYRDLLLLHAVAKRILRMPDDGTSRSRTSPQRAGAPVRGDRPRGAELEPDPQADVDTHGAPLGPMKVPPPSAAPGDAASRSTDPTAYDHLTDFNFLNLR